MAPHLHPSTPVPGRAGQKGGRDCDLGPRALQSPHQASQASRSPSWTAQRDPANFPNFAIPRQGVDLGNWFFRSYWVGMGSSPGRKLGEEVQPLDSLSEFWQEVCWEPAGRAGRKF